MEKILGGVTKQGVAFISGEEESKYSYDNLNNINMLLDKVGRLSAKVRKNIWTFTICLLIYIKCYSSSYTLTMDCGDSLLILPTNKQKLTNPYETITTFCSYVNNVSCCQCQRCVCEYSHSY